MQVSVCYSEPGAQLWLRLDVPEETTVEEAIARSRILDSFPHVDIKARKVGVFGKTVPLSTVLRPGDRVEIYRAILCDPATVPRRNGGEEDEED
ncbi:MAG: RnfH family protein [Halothiobacillaceae bacterium]|jgi:putative ubiquitin-RnfH superfamily antitoxin RatB of RatAB toxin-antitoxin module|nr:RnfH family protein [Halothiobacillaceae bacterium]